jgi:hypothetical protein
VATYSDAGAHARDDAFIRQVTVALITAAGTVAIEDRSQYPDSTMFALRRTLAVNVLQDPETWARRFAWIVQYDQRVRDVAPTADDPTPAPVDDNLLSGIIYWVWNAVSGAGPSLTPPPVIPEEPPPPVVAEEPVAVPHPVSGVTRLMGAPLGAPLPLRTEGDEQQIQLRHPVRPPGAPAGWPGVSPWHEALQRPDEED